MSLKQWIAGIVSISVMAFALAGCGGSTSSPDEKATAETTAPTQQEQEKEPVHLVVWSYMTPNEVAVVDEVAQQWAKETGNTVEVIPDQTGFQEYATAAASGQGPDILYGIPHDNLGSFWKAGLLAEVPDGVINPSDYEQVGINAVSFEGKMYAVPISMEAIGLFYNKAMVQTPPTTWDEFMAIAKDKGFAYKVKDLYFSYGFIGGMGGYVFKDTGKGLDPTDVGLASPGAIAGLQLIADMIHKDKLMPIDIDYDPAKAQFLNGKTAMWLTGPWEVASVREAGLDFGVAPMPTLPNGKPFTPFVGVYAGFVAADSDKQEAAWDLIKYLQQNAPLKLFDTANRIPVKKEFLNTDKVQGDEIIRGFAASAANGVPMPNIPEMPAVWAPAASMFELIVSGATTPEEAAQQTVEAINEAVAGMK